MPPPFQKSGSAPVITAKENSYEVDTIYVDFKKAFDTVSHSYYSFDQTKYGISGNVFNFYGAYLSNRLQCVNISGIHSNLLPECFVGCSSGKFIGVTSLCHIY